MIPQPLDLTPLELSFAKAARTGCEPRDYEGHGAVRHCGEWPRCRHPHCRTDAGPSHPARRWQWEVEGLPV